MLVGSKGGVSVPSNTIVTVPKTGDGTLPGALGGVLMLTALGLGAGVALAKRKRNI